jgi:hypothetical protein
MKPYNGQDLFVMFKGFSKDLLPERIFKAYKDVEKRRIPIEDMIGGKGIQNNNSICRISTREFAIADAYVFPERVLLYTIACLDSNNAASAGYVIAGVVTDQAAGEESSGHEYWLFDAANLAQGPVCKLGHESLNNSTLFHTVYIPSDVAKKLNQKEKSYRVPIREDYPREEIEKWDVSVLNSFESVIWGYFDPSEPEKTQRAEEMARQLAVQRVSKH